MVKMTEGRYGAFRTNLTLDLMMQKLKLKVKTINPDLESRRYSLFLTKSCGDRANSCGEHHNALPAGLFGGGRPGGRHGASARTLCVRANLGCGARHVQTRLTCACARRQLC
jgi:hypothetical protein